MTYLLRPQISQTQWSDILLGWPKSSFRFFCMVLGKPKWTFWPAKYNGTCLLSLCGPLSPSYGGECTEIRNARSWFIGCSQSNWGDNTNTQAAMCYLQCELTNLRYILSTKCHPQVTQRDRCMLAGQSSSIHLAGEERVRVLLNHKSIYQDAPQSQCSYISPYLLHQNSKIEKEFSYLYREDS